MNRSRFTTTKPTKASLATRDIAGGKPHRPKVPYTAVGSAGKIVYDYVIRCFNASSAGLKKPLGLDLRWDTALRDLQIQLELIRNTLMKTTTAWRQPTASRHLILIWSDSDM